MATATLSATERTTTGKGAARKLRGNHQIPGVIYGHHRKSQPLVLDGRELEKLLGHISPDTTVVELHVAGKMAKTLIREIQRHPFKREILHIDFQELVAGEKVTVNIPIVLVGVPNGVRLSEGTLDQVLRELSIEVDPAHIPNHFEVDVTHLDINDSIHVSDIKLPEGIEVFEEADATVCVVAPPRAVEEPVAAAESTVEAAAEPELIRKPKDEGEEGSEET